MIIQGKYVDILNKIIFKAELEIQNGKIVSIVEKEHLIENYILPGFIDAHIHIESSMLVPSEFARLAVLHGTVATISDPHEIANVLGKDGVYYMINNGLKVPFKFHFGAPSCVPATFFETAGAIIDSNDINELMQHPEIYYLAEVMNYPAVIHQDAEMMRKIEFAKNSKKPIDGHAPGILGEDLINYFAAGIQTDHECFTFNEAKEKLELGMKVLIREGSAAKNFEELIDLLEDNYENMMFCSDDKHPDDLILGHINSLCKRAVSEGLDVFKVLQVACINPVKHYNMNVGLLQKGDFADFILVDNLMDFNVLETYIDGKLVAKNGKSFIESIPFEKPNKFLIAPKSEKDFQIKSDNSKIRIIEAVDGSLISNEIFDNVLMNDGFLMPDLEKDILKIAVINRYNEAKVSVAFIKNFGLKNGAIASSVAHDSHNIIVVGVSDEEICKAANLIIENKGGICAVNQEEQKILPLPIAGIMSDLDGWQAGKKYEELDLMAKKMGSKLKSPFMTLSFMALLVIPDLKLSDKGLFSGKEFKMVDLNA